MAGTRGYLRLSLMMAALAGPGHSAFAAPGQETSDHVRTGNAAIATLIQHASERSVTFRGLLNTINASDGIVFIEEGVCGHGMKACFVNVTMAGRHRMLWVMVRPRGNDCEIMGLIGHELRHTVEVLSEPTVTGTAAMYFFYTKLANAGSSPAFETLAALGTGDAVSTEVRQKNRCTKIQ
jgi:hypothetical protein